MGLEMIRILLPTQDCTTTPRTSLDGSKDDSNMITQDLYQDSRTSLDDSREDSHTAPTHPLGQEDHTCVPSMCTDW